MSSKHNTHNARPWHQNEKECRRRLKQIRDGSLKGKVVSEEARFSAHGLVHPNNDEVRRIWLG